MVLLYSHDFLHFKLAVFFWAVRYFACPLKQNNLIAQNIKCNNKLESFQKKLLQNKRLISPYNCQPSKSTRFHSHVSVLHLRQQRPHYNATRHIRSIYLCVLLTTIFFRQFIITFRNWRNDAPDVWHTPGRVIFVCWELETAFALALSV